MKKYFLPPLVTLALCIYTISFADVKINPQKLYKEGVLAYEQEDYPKALRLIQDATNRGLSGKELLGAYLRLYMSTLKLNDAARANHWKERCKSIIPEFDITYSEDQRKLLGLERPYKTLSSNQYPTPNNLFYLNADMEDFSYTLWNKEREVGRSRLGFKLAGPMPGVQLYDRYSLKVYITSILIKRRGEEQEQGPFKLINCDSVVFPAILDNEYIVGLGSYGTNPENPRTLSVSLRVLIRGLGEAQYEKYDPKPPASKGRSSMEVASGVQPSKEQGKRNPKNLPTWIAQKN